MVFTDPHNHFAHGAHASEKIWMQLCSLSYRYLLEPTDATRCFDFAQLTQLSHYVFPLEIHFCIRWLREPVMLRFKTWTYCENTYIPCPEVAFLQQSWSLPWNAVTPPRPSGRVEALTPSTFSCLPQSCMAPGEILDGSGCMTNCGCLVERMEIRSWFLKVMMNI